MRTPHKNLIKLIKTKKDKKNHLQAMYSVK
ncbi:hypothetical protein DES39_1007 [Orbus hercynius]|uniref:Uncharacterized protein n=1 Tax=Orbus hercynius TaxID=593135 RepID=A0A495RKC6_9GAMM|nr:hypothetical protein DES39_1007 [Orbus hercynius]